ncbi:MAG: MoaD/ThiS family protein [Bacteroidota bacterium]
MPVIRFTNALKRFYPALEPLESNASNLRSVLKELEACHPGFSSYIVDDLGQVRKHVNIFVDGKLIRDRECLSDSLQGAKEVYIMQALSGG